MARIRSAAAFRRMAGKAQVFVAPRNDMLRNRLTHVLEVARVATTVADALGLNVALTEAIALGHDCGHGPGGHPAEEAFSGFLPQRLRSRRLGRRRGAYPVEPLQSDSRWDPQPLLEAPCSGDPRGRGGRLE